MTTKADPSSRQDILTAEDGSLTPDEVLPAGEEGHAFEKRGRRRSSVPAAPPKDSSAASGRKKAVSSREQAHDEDEADGDDGEAVIVEQPGLKQGKASRGHKSTHTVIDAGTGETSTEPDDEAPEGELDQEEFGAASQMDDEDFLPGEDGAVDVTPLDDESDGAHASASDRLPSTRDSFQVYMREVSRFPMLSPEEEHELAQHYRTHGDAKSAFRLVSSHLRLVVKIAIDFQRRWMQNVLDLVQEGNVGLMHAVNKFDPDKGIKFSYYASFWIKAYILKFIMDNFRMVKIGTTQTQRKLFFNLNRERQKLIAQGYDPDADMLARSLGTTRDEVMDMEQRMSSGDVSLNLPVGDEQGSATRQDFLPALGPGIEDNLASSEISSMLRSQLATLLPKLSEKEAYILKYRLLSDEPVKLREIGERYGITRERVRQIENRLLKKIRDHLSVDIKDFSEEWISE